MVTALVVGLVLTLVNHADSLRTKSFDDLPYLNLAMNFLVPFVVSIYTKASTKNAERNRSASL